MSSGIRYYVTRFTFTLTVAIFLNFSTPTMAMHKEPAHAQAEPDCKEEGEYDQEALNQELIRSIYKPGHHLLSDNPFNPEVNLEQIKSILDRGADPNFFCAPSTDYRYATPLHIAATFGYYKLARLLILSKANTYIVDRDGKNALHFAAQSPFFDCHHTEPRARCGTRARLLQQLIDAKANVNATSHQSETPLLLLAAVGCDDAIQCLLDNRADVNVAALNGDTPLKIIISRHHATDTMIKKLLSHGSRLALQAPHHERKTGVGCRDLTPAQKKRLARLQEEAQAERSRLWGEVILRPKKTCVIS